MQARSPGRCDVLKGDARGIPRWRTLSDPGVGRRGDDGGERLDPAPGVQLIWGIVIRALDVLALEVNSILAYQLAGGAGLTARMALELLGSAVS